MKPENFNFKIIDYRLQDEFLSACDLEPYHKVIDGKFNACTHIGILTAPDKTVAGLSELCVFNDRQLVIVVGLEVAPQFLGNKLGREMLQAIFEHANQLAQSSKTEAYVATDGFTENGKAYLYKHFEELAEKYESVSFRPLQLA